MVLHLNIEVKIQRPVWDQKEEGHDNF